MKWILFFTPVNQNYLSNQLHWPFSTFWFSLLSHLLVLPSNWSSEGIDKMIASLIIDLLVISINQNGKESKKLKLFWMMNEWTSLSWNILTNFYQTREFIYFFSKYFPKLDKYNFLFYGFYLGKFQVQIPSYWSRFIVIIWIGFKLN